VAVTGNGNIVQEISKMPRSKKYVIDFSPGELLKMNHPWIDVDIFELGGMPHPCLCCENPQDVDIPGRAAIEETIRQAKARELGDAASDPFEMEKE
jgi:hypothetical protein